MHQVRTRGRWSQELEATATSCRRRLRGLRSRASILLANRVAQEQNIYQVPNQERPGFPWVYVSGLGVRWCPLMTVFRR